MFEQAPWSRRRSRWWFGLSSLVLAIVLLAGCSGGQTNTQQTPTTNQFVTLPLGIPTAALNAPITGPVPDNQILHVNVTFALDENALKQFNQGGHLVKPDQSTNGADIAKQLGISDADYKKIKDFFGVNDASLTLSQTHTSLNVDIKAGEAAKILQTKFVYHSLNGRTYYTPDPSHLPQVPQAIAGKILAVTGLDTYSQAPKTGFHQSGQSFKPAGAKNFGLCPLNVPGFAGRDQVARSYGFDKLWQRGWMGQKYTVDLVEIDGVSQSDLQPYFDCVGYKGKVSFTTVDSGVPAPQGETTLDIDMIAGLASDVNIHDYQTDISKAADGGWQYLLDTFQRIIDDHAHNLYSQDVVSVSLGAPEAGLTSSLAAAFSQRLHILTDVEHMTVFVASGDCAAYMDGVYGQLDVSFPASDPYAVAVGGTTLKTDLSGQQRSSEIAWSNGSDKQQCNNSWGTGGGLSTFFAKPDWQTGVSGIQNKYSNGKRQLPDIAAAADNLLVFFQGIWQPIGGTSAATPIWATAMIILNQGYIATKDFFSYAPDTFYFIQSNAAQARPFYQITQGDNLYYKA
ncbi:MAG TPA: S53 family peptidase, partial [Ktedonobacteraceae bacterium]